MQSKQKILELQEQLPHGYQFRISEMTGLAQPTVSRFFQRGTLKSNNSIAILHAALQVRDEFQAKKQQVLANF